MAGSKGIFLAVSAGLALALCILSLLRPQRPGYAAAGGVFCVVPPGESTGPFSPCDQVFSNVQAAVDVAAGGEEIWVATGVYSDVHVRNDTVQSVYLDKSLTIRGGYTIPFSDPPDPALHVTTLDAQDWGRVLFVTGQISVTIEGLRLTGGWSFPAGSIARTVGGGIYVDAATILLQDNVITGNRTGPGSEQQAGYGGGLYLNNVHAVLLGNYIHNNLNYGRSYGGGIAVRQSVVTLANNTIFSNTAGLTTGDVVGPYAAYGGGIYVEESEVTIENNVVSDNMARPIEGPANQNFGYGYGGGLALVDSSGSITANSIHHNLAADWTDGFGGGIYIEGAGSLYLAHNVIEDNVAGAYQHGNGGGLMAAAQPEEAPSLTLYNNHIVSNTAALSGTLGIGGGVALLFGSFTGSPQPVVTVTHNHILSNTAIVSGGVGLGGGLVAGRAQLYLDQNLVAGNVAVLSGANGHGGGLYLGGNQAHLTRNVIQHNQASTSGGGLLLDGGDTTMANTAVIDNQAGQGGGLRLICGAGLAATHLTLARNEAHGILLATLASGCNASNLPPETAVLTNTILAGHPIGAFAAAATSLALHGVLWHDTPTVFQAEPGAQVTISHQYFGDPLFAGDGYHITAGSAARFRGILTGVMVDIDGQPRPPANPSLGADEYWLATHFLPVIARSP